MTPRGSIVTLDASIPELDRDTFELPLSRPHDVSSFIKAFAVTTLTVLPKNMTKTAQYAAVAAKTSCLLARVNMEQLALKSKVNRNTIKNWKLLLRVTSVASAGWSLIRMKTGTSKRQEARTVRVIRRKMSRLVGEVSWTISFPSSWRSSSEVKSN